LEDDKDKISSELAKLVNKLELIFIDFNLAINLLESMQKKNIVLEGDVEQIKKWKAKLSKELKFFEDVSYQST
jgi:hypothetical protein